MDKDDKKEILDAIEALARMTQTQFDRVNIDMEVMKEEMKETNTRLSKLENRENSQDNILDKHTDDIRIIKTKVGIA